MTADHAGTARRWAELVSTCPHPLGGRTVLDAGAGAGAASKALAAQRARPIAMDLSFGMLGWNADRPPSAAADIRTLPLAADSVDDPVAAFVLNHLTDPEAGLAELARVTRPGRRRAGHRLQHHQPRSGPGSDRRGRQDFDWRIPGWYTELKGHRPAIPSASTTCPPS